MSVYASIGGTLTHYDLPRDTAAPIPSALIPRASLALPYKVQYVWPHPAQPPLYAACSNGSPDARGDAHCIAVLRRDTATGALSLHGAPVALRSRPVHLTVDGAGRHALVAYNYPSHLTVHRIESDGAIGNVVQQHATLDTGIYAHQVRVALSNQAVILVTRGNKATDARYEEPGALKVFAYDSDSGQLTPSVSVAPNGGVRCIILDADNRSYACPSQFLREFFCCCCAPGGYGLDQRIHARAICRRRQSLLLVLHLMGVHSRKVWREIAKEHRCHGSMTPVNPGGPFLTSVHDPQVTIEPLRVVSHGWGLAACLREPKLVGMICNRPPGL